MSLVNDFASGAGIPAASVTFAVAMYGACVAAEKAARPEALHEIGCFLKDSSWSQSIRPSVAIARIFGWTFGDRHLSWKCALRSVIATLTLYLTMILVLLGLGSYVPAISIWFAQDYPSWASPYVEIMFLGFLIIFGFLPDYIALAKTRLLLHRVERFGGGFKHLILMVFIDIVLSIGISVTFALSLSAIFVFSFWLLPGMFALLAPYIWAKVLSTFEAEALYIPEPAGFTEFLNESQWLIRSCISPWFAHDPTRITFVSICFASTLLTSVWSALTFLSVVVVKVAAPVQHFTMWFFDLDQHPVKTIGLICGAFVIAAAFMWSVVRAVM